MGYSTCDCQFAKPLRFFSSSGSLTGPEGAKKLHGIQPGAAAKLWLLSRAGKRVADTKLWQTMCGLAMKPTATCNTYAMDDLCRMHVQHPTCRRSRQRTCRQPHAGLLPPAGAAA
jgi:hypothetical protein